MAKPGKMKKRCEKYKAEGRREKNKILKQERAKKREEKFRKRREEGKTYVYKPNPYKKGTKEYYQERKKRLEKNKETKTPYQKWTSIFRKLQNELAVREKEEKKRIKEEIMKKDSDYIE